MKQKPAIPASAPVSAPTAPAQTPPQQTPSKKEPDVKNASQRENIPVDRFDGERMHMHERLPWQRAYMRRMVLGYVLVYGLYLIITCGALLHHQRQYRLENEEAATFSEQTAAAVEECRKTALEVECGTYVEGISELSLRNGNYRISMEIWFSWDGEKNVDMLHNFRIYQGTIHAMDILQDEHENGQHFQRARITATVQEDYWTASFPLDSHELFCYIESNYNGSDVLLVPDADCSGSNPDLYVSGYKVDKVSMGEMYFTYENSHGDRDHEGTRLVSEVMTKVNISRDGLGLYVKCFIALVGTTTWVFIAMFINTYHHVDPLSMVPSALFGTVSNVLVGASLVPDSLRLGLLEYVNAFGILTILGVAISIITINRLRSKYQATAFAGLLGRTIFWILLAFSLTGNLLLPMICISGWAV